MTVFSWSNVEIHWRQAFQKISFWKSDEKVSFLTCCTMEAEFPANLLAALHPLHHQNLLFFSHIPPLSSTGYIERGGSLASCKGLFLKLFIMMSFLQHDDSWKKNTNAITCVKCTPATKNIFEKPPMLLQVERDTNKNLERNNSFPPTPKTSSANIQHLSCRKCRKLC